MVAKGFVELKQIKMRFYNREMTRRVDRGKARVLTRFGAFARRAARSSMKKAPANPKRNYDQQRRYQRGRRRGEIYWARGNYSAKGRPPHWRTDEPNMRTILFGIEDENTVIIGPIWLPASSRMSRTAPNVHEFGGKVTRSFSRRSGSVDTIGGRSKSRTKIYRYPSGTSARKFMLPAGNKAIIDLRRKSAPGFITR